MKSEQSVCFLILDVPELVVGDEIDFGGVGEFDDGVIEIIVGSIILPWCKIRIARHWLRFYGFSV